MTPEQIVFFGVSTVPMVVGIVQVIKQVGLPSRFAGLVALIVGLGIGMLAGAMTDTQLAVAAFQGIIAGLAASGAWNAGTTAVAGGFTHTHSDSEADTQTKQRRFLK